MNKKIILASKSPRRIQLLTEVGFDISVVPADINEEVDPSLGPEDTVKSLSYQKALAVREKLLDMIGSTNHDYVNPEISEENLTPILSEDIPIIAADTIVYLDSIIGKPKNKEDALNTLMNLSGKCHYVYTGVCILSLLDSNKIINFSEETKVFFKEYTKEDLTDYLETDEPYDKAGAYAIQGYFGRFIDHIEGDYDNVMGLPVTRLLEFL